MYRNELAIAIRERMEELAFKKGTTPQVILVEMREEQMDSRFSRPILPTPDIEILHRFCVKLDISLSHFFENDRFK